MATIQTRVDDEIKEQADSLFKSMGITTTDAVRMFLVQSINAGGLPFRPTGKQPNHTTLEALNEEGGNVYKNVDDLSQLWKS